MRQLFYLVFFVFILSTNTLLGVEKFKDFPTFNITGDITVDYNKKGYATVEYFDSVKEDNTYVLIYKKYTRSGELIDTLNLVQSGLSKFEIELDESNEYEFCIVALNNESVVRVSPVEKVNLGELLSTNDSRSLTRSTSSSLNGMDVTLDIDTDGFPYLSLLAEITSDGSQYDGTGDYPLLDSSNFIVKEDGRLQTIKKIIPPTQSNSTKIVDIVFVHDDSGSLGDEAAQVKANIQTFLAGLVSKNIDFRVGLVPYGGSGYSSSFSPPSGRILNGGTLYDNAASLISDIDSMRFDGGTERAFDAMNLATNGTLWRPQTQKVIILVTDENNDTGSIDETTATATLVSNGVTLYGLTNGHAEFTRMATATGGKIFDVRSDFSSILDEIGQAIVSKYIVQYETDNPTVDGKERTVNLAIDVTDSNSVQRGGNLDIKYTPEPPLNIVTTPSTDALSTKGQPKYTSLNISAVITNASNIQNGITATLYYKNNSGTYVSVNMNDLGSDIFSATIPSTDVEDPYIKYYISATDGGKTYTFPSNEPANNPMTISILPNLVPEIISVNVGDAKENTDFKISATIQDVTNYLDKVTLFYREKGEFTYKKIEQVYTNKETKVNFQATIPASDVTKNGIEYFIEAIDDLGVNHTYGDISTPNFVYVQGDQVQNGSKDISNITVHADSFVDNGNNTWTASGNVYISKQQVTRATSKMLSISTSVILNYDTGKVTSVSSGKIIALAIKRDLASAPTDMPLFNGSFEVDAVTNPPVMTLTSGTSIFRPAGVLEFFYPNSSQITIKSDEVILSDIYTKLSAIQDPATIQDLVLSQSGASSQKITLGYDANKTFAIKNSVFTLKKLQMDLDFVGKTLSGTADMEFGSGAAAFSVGGTLGFTYSPIELNTLGGSVGLTQATSTLLTLPTTPPSPFGLRLKGGSFLLDGLASTKIPVFSVTGNMLLVDAGQILPSTSTAIGADVIGGDITLIVDTSGKVIAAGNIKLLEKFELANAKLTLGNPSSLDANLNVLQLVRGRLYLQMGTNGSYFEMTGNQNLAFTIPDAAPWIGGYKLSDLSTDATFRFNSSSIDKAELRATYKLFFVDLGLRLDMSDINDPDFYVTGMNKTIKVFSRGRDFRAAAEQNINVAESADYIMIRVTGNNLVAPEFDLKLPDGSTFTPATAVPSATANVFYLGNANAKEAFYAVKNPALGDYKVTVTNETALGGYTIDLTYPNIKPQINIDFAQDIIWDGSSAVDIAWTDKDDDNDAKISLYYATDATASKGSLIISGISEDDTTDKYSWMPSTDMASGKYYIFAKIDDGEFKPETSVSIGTITVNNPNAPTKPSNLVGTGLDNSIKVTWDADASNPAYNIFLKDGQKVYEFAAGKVNEYTVSGLKSNTTYDVYIRAISDSGYISLNSDTISVTTNNTPLNLGGAPDLTIDETLSTITSDNGKSNGVTTVALKVNNVGDSIASSYKVTCFLGGMSDSNIFGEFVLGSLAANTTADVSCSYDPSNTLVESRDIYVRVSEVFAPELDISNNITVLKSELPVAYDFNGNGEVDISDIMAIASRWGAKSGDSNYDASFDLTNSGDIDIADIMIVANKWGSKV